MVFFVTKRVESNITTPPPIHDPYSTKIMPVLRGLKTLLLLGLHQRIVVKKNLKYFVSFVTTRRRRAVTIWDVGPGIRV